MEFDEGSESRPPVYSDEGRPPAVFVHDVPEPELGFLDRFRFTPEPPWDRAAGLIQVIVVVILAIGLSVVGTILGLVVDYFFTDSFDLTLDPASEDFNERVAELIENAPAMLVFSALFQQFGQGVSAFLISKFWKGYGVVRDWGLSFKWVDVPIGAGLAVVGFALSQGVSYGLSPLVGVDDASEADNGVILTGFEDSLWLYPMLVVVVIGAPLSEEIAFRGILQRALARFGGPVPSILLSSLIFALVHIGGTSFGGQLVLWAAIFMLGVVFAIAAAYFKRLGPSIVAHLITNLGASIVLLTQG